MFALLSVAGSRFGMKHFIHLCAELRRSLGVPRLAEMILATSYGLSPLRDLSNPPH
jgi:hypothetical protein